MRLEFFKYFRGLEPVKGQRGLVPKHGKKLGERITERMVVIDDKNKIFFDGVHR
jgi:hypothetical protein